MHFVIKAFPEIFVKSQAVRKYQIETLRRNLLKRVRRALPEVGSRVSKDWEKVEVELESESERDRATLIQCLQSTPGVEKFSQITAFEFRDIEHVCEVAMANWADSVAGKSIAVRVKRSGKHSFRSVDIERKLGGLLVARASATGVDLQDPQVLVELEVRKERCFMLSQTWRGMGGYPLGTQGKALCLLSGGYDSSVAALHAIRRGQLVHFVFFNLGGRQHEVAVRRMAWYLWERYGSSAPVNFYSVPFDQVTDEIGRLVPGQYGTLILKRQMMRAASRVASVGGIHALITGEAVGQVSTQTLGNLRLVDECVDRLVMRPLVYIDKGEIIRQAREAGTAELAEASPEYCGLTSRKPTAHGKLMDVQEIEQRLSPQVLESALQRMQKVPIEKLPASLQSLPVDILTSPIAGDTIVDVRHPDETEDQPLNMYGFEVIEIPFFEVQKRLPEADNGGRYLLYCQRGIMSRLHAELLLEAGFSRVGVYKPL